MKNYPVLKHNNDFIIDHSQFNEYNHSVIFGNDPRKKCAFKHSNEHVLYVQSQIESIVLSSCIIPMVILDVLKWCECFFIFMCT